MVEVTIPNNKPVKLMGFGEHYNPGNFSKYKQAKIISDIAISLLLTMTVMTVLASAGFVVVPVIGGLGAASAFGSASVALLASSSLLASGAVLAVVHEKSSKNALFGVLNKIMDQIEQPTELGRAENCEMLVCEDTMESFEWKKKLIAAAEHNIVLSGNYCGGKTFDEVLDLIYIRMQKKPHLKVIIISSDKFITHDNQERINRLEQHFSDRFQFVESPDIYHINPGVKQTTNHTKSLAIDFGKYFMLGGSGLEDKYALAKGLGDRGDQQASKVGGILGWFLPRGFRDQDFVFHCCKKRGIGKRVYIESIKLALRWEGLSKLKAFGTDVDLAHDFKACSSVAKSLLLDETSQNVKQRPMPTTSIKEFHSSKKRHAKCLTKVYCTGPEHGFNPFEKEIIKRFNNAEKRIVIDHMYFHPTKGVMKALIEAANRGVKITIITNGYNEKTSPKGHQFFGPRNRYNYCELKNALKGKQKNNVSVYEFKVRKTTLHKKVIVVDDYIISGSSNLGYKSLVTMSDHEMNFVTRNKQAADETANIALTVDAKVDVWESDIIQEDDQSTEVKNGVSKKVDAQKGKIVSDVAKADAKRAKKVAERKVYFQKGGKKENGPRGQKIEDGYARKINNFNLDISVVLSAARHRIMAPLVG